MGKASQPWVILLHSATGCIRDWRHVIPVIERAGFRALAYDRPGFGTNPKEEVAMPPPALYKKSVEQLRSIMDESNIERASLIGHSDGASIALLAGAMMPERITSLILEAPHAWDEPALQDSFKAFQASQHYTDHRSRFWQAMRRDHGIRAERVVERWMSCFEVKEWHGWSIRDAIPKIRAPTQVHFGLRDPWFSKEQTMAIAAATPSGTTPLNTFVVHPEAAHVPHAESRDKFNSAVLAWLQANCGRHDEGFADRAKL